MPDSPSPGQLSTPADCSALAAHEWDSGEANQSQWKDRETYMTVRAAALAGRLPAPEPSPVAAPVVVTVQPKPPKEPAKAG
jgi:hypothetical protein